MDSCPDPPSPKGDRVPSIIKEDIDAALDSSASESEFQHVLKVRPAPTVRMLRSSQDHQLTRAGDGLQQAILDPANPYRRKSSMVGAENDPRHAANDLNRRLTQCQVHQLLECQRRVRKARAANGAAEAIAMEQEELLRKLRPEEQNGMRPSPGGSGSGGAVERNMRSRLMTKKQLQDMAVGVKELSKRLGSVRQKLEVTTVFLLTKKYDESLIAKTRELAEWLLGPERDRPYRVYVEDILEDNKAFDAKGLVAKDPSFAERLKYWNNDMCRYNPETFDFVVTLGGDGTVLYASWLFQRIVPPVLSFALGSLGFLTKFDFDEHRGILTRAFRDGLVVSLRLRFECTIMRSLHRGVSRAGSVAGKRDGRAKDDGSRERGGASCGRADAPAEDLLTELLGEENDDEHTHKPEASYDILNDVVVDRGPNATMSAIEIFGDDEHFTTVQADGVCVATPTGSTAYNLSAGGSLCHPENPVILVTAICAHTLSFRPIILPDSIVLRLGVPYDARTSSWASFDGRERIELHPGDYVTISASRFPFANVMPEGRRSEDWVNSLSRTLQWNSRQRQKSFKEWPKDEEPKIRTHS